MKIIFMGTPEFAVATLAALTEHHEVTAVITQPDMPQRRGKKLLPPPVKVFALEKGLTVLQPKRVKSATFFEKLCGFEADVIVVAAYGQILPKRILEWPRLGCLNVHASLLPRWRGAAPIQRAIEAGDTESGVTIMQMNEGLDTGDMLIQRRVQIDVDETGQTLHDKLAALGAQVILEALESAAEGNLSPTPQDDTRATYAAMLAKTDGHIDWHRTPREIQLQVNAFNPWPTVYTRFGTETLKIWQVEDVTPLYPLPPGTPGQVSDVTKMGIVVSCKGGCLMITELQGVNGKRMKAKDFLLGHAMPLGTILDDATDLIEQ